MLLPVGYLPHEANRILKNGLRKRAMGAVMMLIGKIQQCGGSNWFRRMLPVGGESAGDVACRGYGVDAGLSARCRHNKAVVFQGIAFS